MAKKIEISANEYCVDLFRRPIWDSEVVLVPGHKPSPVEQSHKDACDINMIVKRYQDGLPPSHLDSGPGHYGDFSNIHSYADAMMAVKEANDAFMALPVELRVRFGHDPGEFIKFCEDPKNGEELVKMGLATRDVPDKSPEVKNESGSVKTNT